jgi:hypothetical protein
LLLLAVLDGTGDLRLGAAAGESGLDDLAAAERTHRQVDESAATHLPHPLIARRSSLSTTTSGARHQCSRACVDPSLWHLLRPRWADEVASLIEMLRSPI